MVRAVDGRLVRARRNGFCFVSIEDAPGQRFTVDFAHAEQLAAALESGSACSMSTHVGQVLEFTGTRLGARGDTSGARDFVPRPRTLPQVVTGPWELGEPERHQLAAEIRRAVAS